MDAIKLDLGADELSPPGFTPMGHFHGTAIYPLDVQDESIDVIRASHVLEHFPKDQGVNIVKQWASKLKPGGTLKIAVPNTAWIAENYHELNAKGAPVEGWLFGGQVDEHDFHCSGWDEEKLAETLRLGGLIDIEKWEADCQDCSSLDVSLNLQGVKPRKIVRLNDPFPVSAVMSVPRLGFMDNFYCTYEALAPMGITLRRHMGAYWEACLERTIIATIEEDQPSAILTLDYDTVYKRSDVEKLIQIMVERPEVDALAALQAGRQIGQPLLTLDLPLGVKSHDRIPHGVFADDVTEVRTAHFGLTLIRVASLLKAKKPWLQGQVAPDNTWGEGRVDADIAFWRNWANSGLRVFSANRVPVGHMELMIKWPTQNMGTFYQLPKDYQKEGKPKDVWQ